MRVSKFKSIHDVRYWISKFAKTSGCKIPKVPIEILSFPGAVSRREAARPGQYVSAPASFSSTPTFLTNTKLSFVSTLQERIDHIVAQSTKQHRSRRRHPGRHSQCDRRVVVYGSTTASAPRSEKKTLLVDCSVCSCSTSRTCAVLFSAAIVICTSTTGKQISAGMDRQAYLTTVILPTAPTHIATNIGRSSRAS
jgi:hypothetical protein